MTTLIDLTGKRFGKLVVLERFTMCLPPKWICKCDCGNEHITTGGNLKNGDTKSCGCFRKARNTERLTTHGRHRTRTYNIWAGMKTRCFNKNTTDYAYYGGRGITVCDEWLKFDAFYDDMGECPDGFTLEREDNDGDYTPDNCKWVSRATQNKNTRSTVFITHDGETLCLVDWAHKLGVKPRTLSARRNRGWSDHDIITRPLRRLTSRIGI